MTTNDEDKIYQAFYSGEMGISLSKTRKDKARYSPNKKRRTEKPVKDVKLNCWAAISERGATSHEIFKEILKSCVYHPIIEEPLIEMDELYPEGYYFFRIT